MPRNATDTPHPVDVHVGRRVCGKRLDLGYNQSDLGRALGLTFQQVQKYEKGSNRISASKLYDIARFFKVEVGYFYEGLQAHGVDGVPDGAVVAEMAISATKVGRQIVTGLARLDAPQLSAVATMVSVMAPDPVEV